MMPGPPRAQRGLVEPQVPALRAGGRRRAASHLPRPVRRARRLGALRRQGQRRRGSSARASWDATERFGHEEALLHLVSWLREHRRRLQARGRRPRVVHGGMAFSRPGAGRRRRPAERSSRSCRSRPCISRTTWRRSGSCGSACRTCRRSPASTRPSTATSRRSRSCSPCRAR